MEKTKPEYNIATLAGGCFWCTTSAFDGLDGILSITSGYTGGHLKNPTYEQVCSGNTGHYEAVQIEFDPEILPYEKILKIFFRQLDPTDGEGSFVDRGSQYRSSVFYHSEEQKKIAQSLLKTIEESGLFEGPVATRILPMETFYPAESYHQDYHKKNPVRYQYYRSASGRDVFIDQYKQVYDRILKD